MQGWTTLGKSEQGRAVVGKHGQTQAKLGSKGQRWAKNQQHYIMVSSIRQYKQ